MADELEHRRFRKRWTTERWTPEKYTGHPPQLPGLGWLRHVELMRCERCAVELTCLWYGPHPLCCACGRAVYQQRAEEKKEAHDPGF
jgi:hypothetical protein